MRILDENPELVNATCRSDGGLLHWASAHSDHRLAELLIGHGADLNARDEAGQTPLHLVAISCGAETQADTVYRLTQIAELLLASGSDVNAVNEQGSSPLHLAAIKADLELVELLLRNNADVNAETAGGATPLACVVARDSGDSAPVVLEKDKIADLLRRHGATESGLPEPKTVLISSGKSGGIEDHRSISGESINFSVKLGKLVPPKEKSAKIRGEGCITFAGHLLIIKGKIDNEGLVILFTIPAALVTNVVVELLFRVQIGMVLALPLAGAVWYFIFRALILKKAVSMIIKSDSGKAYYMQKRRIACVELPDGRWIAVRCLDGDDATFLNCLQESYGDRLVLGK
jgi:hypothetical protein